MTRTKFSMVLAVAAMGCGAAARGSTSGVRGVEAAGLPYRVIDARSGREVAEADFWAALGRARAVCVGEEHPNPHHHWAQLQVVEHLSSRAQTLGLGMEMVQRPFQGPLDDFAQGKIDEATMLSRIDWKKRWGYDFGLYRPMVKKVVAVGGKLIALNPPKELIKKVAKEGIESLSDDERKTLPELKLDVAEHRAWFNGVMEEMGGADAHKEKKPDDAKDDAKKDRQAKKPDHAKNESGAKDSPPAGGTGGMPSLDHIYAVQVIWDESMADGAASWLADSEDNVVILLAGAGHCHDSAVVGRLKRRGLAEVVSVHPIIESEEGAVADALAKPINDYLFVMRLPK